MSLEAPSAGRATTTTTTTSQLVLEVEERYARERYQLYRAKSYGPRPTSPVRLRELERAWKLAESRLHRDWALKTTELRVRSKLHD
jgi:hypothetical protein